MKYLIIVKNNLKKSKATCVIILLLVSLATMLSLTALTVLNSSDKNLQEIMDDTNMADLLAINASVAEKDTVNILDSIENVEAYEKTSIIYYDSGSIEDTTLNKEPQDIPILVARKSETRTISKLSIVSESETQHENGAYLPYYLCVTEGYTLGDNINVKLGKEVSKFVIDGFYVDVNFCSPSVLTMYLIYVNDDIYDEIYEQTPLMNLSNIYYAKAVEGVSPNKIEIAFSDEMGKLENPEGDHVYQANSDTTRTGSTMYSQILMSVMLGFGFILIFITIVVIRFVIITYIEQNYRNIGVLEATGYTSGNMIMTFVSQFALLSVAGVIIGAVLAFLGKPFIIRLLEIASGLTWNIQFSPILVIAIIVSELLFIALVTAVLSLRIRKISVLNALREGVTTHSFKKNHVSLEKVSLPVNLSLGTKKIFEEGKQNFSITIIVMILCSSLVLSFMMYKNFQGNMESDIIWDFIGTERGDVLVICSDDNLKEQVREMEGVTGVKALSFTNGKIGSGSNQEVISLHVSDDYSDFSKGVILEGRYPIYDNEISVTTRVSEALHAVINDTVKVTIDDVEEEYLVVGITQQINNLGKSASLTLDGIHKLIPDFAVTTNYLLLEKGIEPKDFIEDAYDEVGRDNIELMNYRKVLGDITTPYETSMSILSVASFIIDIIIIALVLFLLMSIKVIRDTKKNAIYKAMGYTTAQLMVQTIIAFEPAIILGCIIGIAIGIFGSNNIIALMMSFAGVKKCFFEIPAVLSVLAAIALVLVSVLVAVFTSMRIRKVTPSKMLSEF